MDSIKKTYTSFPFEWSVKSSSYKIRYRKAFAINVIDETFCSIINAKGNSIEFSELCYLLGFNLQDLAETDIFNIYLKGLTEYNLIEIDKEIILLTDFGQDALQSKLKYKYYFAATELLENQTATGESIDFSFKSLFDIENSLSHEREITKEIFDNLQLKQKLQLQLFGSDIYRGEIIELYQTDQYISYKSISLECEPFEIDNLFQLTIYKGGINKPDIQLLIDLPENEELKSKLIRRGMYHHILSENNSISVKDIETYIDLWNWKELAENPKTDWNDKNVFKLFLENGDGSVWSTISEKAPEESIKSVIHLYAEYWNWSKLTGNFDDNFINEHIENYNWDFEELSYKNAAFVVKIATLRRAKHLKFWEDQIQKNSDNNASIKELSKSKNYDIKSLKIEQQVEIVELLTLETLKSEGWDWNYLSLNLPDDFIESHIDEFPWDYYVITEVKSEILRNLFRKQVKISYAHILLSKPWNWKFISAKFDINFLYKEISSLATKLEWHTVLERFFSDEEISAKCLKEESFKSLLKQYLPDNFVVAHQKYLWTTSLIDFFEQQNLIQWESKAYINGFDTNENVEWDNTCFQKYHSRITSEKGFLNVSKQISDYSLIEEFPDFAWNWEGVSKNKNLIDNLPFIERAFVGEFSFSNNLLWSEILSQSTFDFSFWNNNLESFNNATNNEKQSQFWVSLTQKEEQEYIFANSHFPWDWTFITENSTEETILDSFDDIDLFEKWDWKIATRKLDKETVLDILEDLARFIDWKFLITEVFTIENELAMDKQLPRIAACLSVVNNELRKDIWRALTIKFPFEILFPIVKATHSLDLFEWDWDYISNHKFFPTDIATLNLFQKKINWSILSESNAIQQKFNPKSWNTGKEWFSNIDRYLQKFDNNWDWKVLSQNRNINYNRLLLQKYKGENWDWEYLTEFGGFLLQQKRDNEKYLEQILKQFQKIKFDILSKRKDINIDSDLILSTKDKNWDWQILSENKKAEISIELILELKNKNWNWKAISQRKKIDFTNETFIQLLDKDWDWEYLSNDTNIEFNAEFIERTKSKPWNWKNVSRHKFFVPTIELLSLTKDFDLDWEYLSKHSGLNPTKELLAKFENKWDWHSITENPQINFTDIAFIERFADKWNWRFICESGKLLLNSQVLNQFKEHLEWDLISSNNNIDFTVEIIQEFKPFWNWTALKNNKRVEELLGNYVNNEINNSSTLNFIDRIEQQWSKWKGSIYHFSHIDNAVEIIKNRKIQSRNKATIKGDAAGNVVHLRNDAHDYARFYFRPHTPTQFYNEFLGKNTSDGYDSKTFGWVSWYEKARGLGFPKCPIPIFFRFSLQDVLFKNEEQCCISNGNMQTGSTQFGSIEKMINRFGFDDLYYTPQQYATKEDYNRYRNYAQQEFLVKDELTFDDLSDFEIVCPSEADRTLLKNLLGNEHKDIFSKIVVDRRYYNNENPRVRIEEEDFELHIKSEFNGQGYFILNGTSNIKEIEILAGDISKMDNDKIIFNSYVSLGNLRQNIRLSFIDESNRNWFVYANKKKSLAQNMVLTHSVWDEIIEINYLLNTKLEKSKLLSLLDEQNYNPYSLYEMAFGVKYIFQNIPIDKDRIKLFSCSNTKLANLQALYSFNKLQAVWAYDIMEDFQKYQTERKQLEKENLVTVFGDMDEDTILIDGNDNFHLYFNLRLIFDHYNEVYSNINLIKILCKCEELESYYNKRIRHYSLNTHTVLVINQYCSYFQSSNELIKSISSFCDDKWFLLFLALHDIGKPKAFEEGNKDNQYFHSQLILKKFWSKLPATSDKDLLIALSLLNSDCIGEYFQAKLPLHETQKRILELADSCNMNVFKFFKIYMIYYQCDIASYTADAGGIKFLEQLFEYEKGKKIFDKEEGLLKMSPKYWEMYKKLKSEIEDGD